MQTKPIPIFVFGNPDCDGDKTPIALLPKLREFGRQHGFVFHHQDPNEEWETVDPFILIDTVRGISEVTVFSDVQNFIKTKSLTMHDIDVGFVLLFLKKLKKIQRVMIIGVPSVGSHAVIINSIMKILSSMKP